MRGHDSSCSIGTGAAFGCRQGDLSAGSLQQRFALALESEAPDLFLELAELMPSAQQRSALLEAAQQAGWRAAGMKPLSTQVQTVSQQSLSSFISLTPRAQCTMATRTYPGELRVLKGSELDDRQRQM